MPTQFTCKCGLILVVLDEHRGTPLRCPKCQTDHYPTATSPANGSAEVNGETNRHLSSQAISSLPPPVYYGPPPNATLAAPPPLTKSPLIEPTGMRVGHIIGGIALALFAILTIIVAASSDHPKVNTGSAGVQLFVTLAAIVLSVGLFFNSTIARILTLFFLAFYLIFLLTMFYLILPPQDEAKIILMILFALLLMGGWMSLLDRYDRWQVVFVGLILIGAGIAGMVFFMLKALNSPLRVGPH
jgi:hypothetical protein